MNETNEKDLVSDIFSILKTVFFAIIVALFINNFIIINAVIPTGSMENTIMTGDRIIANRLAYTFGDIERGDIVVFRSPDDDDELLIKRVIGLPNDTVDIVKGKVFINGEYLEEDYINNNDDLYSGSFVVPTGCYFMMGDNRSHSIDSRFWDDSYVSKEDILGEALFKYYPGIKLIK